jgi:hypothetical protein
MGKKYKAKLCVYCGQRPSNCGDHVVAREFFLVHRRHRLPQAPACNQCNREKSELEHYLTAVLPFGGRHQDAATNLSVMVPKRLQHNAKLGAHLEEGYTGEKLPLKSGQVENLFVFIAKGLLWHHWQSVLGSEDCAAATVLRPDGDAPLHRTLAMLKPRNRVNVDLGAGTLIYEGLQTIDSPQSSLWRFLIYGGLCFAEESRHPGVKSSLIFAVTGPKALLPTFWSTVFGSKLDAAS